MRIKMAMFQASAELREYVSGGPPPKVSAPHVEWVNVIVEAMQSDQGVDVPCLGSIAVVPVPGKRPKLIFHGAEEINSAVVGQTKVERWYLRII